MLIKAYNLVARKLGRWWGKKKTKYYVIKSPKTVPQVNNVKQNNPTVKHLSTNNNTVWEVNLEAMCKMLSLSFTRT